ncbi:MAG: cytochrome C [Geobacter sp.]|nr:cytochrome C [Geobacter sp.]
MRYGILLILLLLPLTAASGAQNGGKADFEMFCSGCHPDGGNAINPAKTLRKMDREANGVKTAADIVRIMRKPGQGMRAYTKDDISNKRAKALAEYVLKTF